MVSTYPTLALRSWDGYGRHSMTTPDPPRALSGRRRVRLFDALPDGIRLEKRSVSDGPFATH
jgi:hypothetical protein